MNKLNTILIIVLIFLSLLAFRGFTPSEKISLSDDLPTYEITAKKMDRKAEILSAYLAKFNSPMQYHAQDFIDASQTFGLDWKMLPAIAGVESTFGKNIPGGYNAYGWGIYGSNRVYFKSWRDGMFTVAKGLKENYVNRGLTNPYSMNRVYAASPVWGSKVTYFMLDLEKFYKEYEALGQNKVTFVTPDKTAASSALLASNQ